ncbi:heat shock protein Hsp20 [Caldalkalibacillus thermarum TA2.A1]|uniref:Heat shock protein Hsp20 n=1 Tax=Caldalkalibacillus thermarum (strain TA2.A1) TaxID=986075 RepID=F5L7F2_CALTT|nr:Hsp20/alpha crystallin family protein [Caldalkalibacillus thermarum]EGL82744.1 heat shock protein Hsp20 [Caldalkalibacillus thermarum TA2.A1]QZT32558.1 Hsp20/alpha crystallin family protein [Caldalkalibacillus thermarum TA2.A1]
MALIPYEPFRRLEHLRRDLDRFFHDLPLFNQELNIPRVDVYETDTEVIASCELPGLEKKEDVDIDVQEQQLTISGVINQVQEVQEEHMYRKERFSGRFQRTVPLPAPVSAEGTKATYKQGILEIRMPKQERTNRKRIDVEFH